MRLAGADGERLEIDHRGERVVLELPVTAAAHAGQPAGGGRGRRAIGVMPGGRVELRLSPGRGQRRALAGGDDADR